MRKLWVVMTATSMVVTGCATLPSSTEPQVIRGFTQETSAAMSGPELDQEPDLLLRGFYAANTIPTQRYQLARSYLSESASQAWNPTAEIVVLDRIDIATSQVEADDTVAYVVTGTIVGSISAGGTYTSRYEDYRTTVTLVQTDGQWRINQLPNQIVVERTELRNRYAPEDMYFFDPSGTRLVADRRWFFYGPSGTDGTLIAMLLQGPSSALAPGLLAEIPQGAGFGGFSDDGAYLLTGMAGLDDQARRRLAASLVWTLASADVAGPYRFLLDDGTYLLNDEGGRDLTADHFAAFNPAANTATSTSLLAVINGSVHRVNQGMATPVSTALGRGNQVESLAVAGDGMTGAAVTATGEGDTKQSALWVGNVDTTMTQVSNAATFSAPTLEPEAHAVWVVQDGRTVLRVARSASTTDIARTEVDISEWGAGLGDISVLQLSPSGVRAALVIDGRVYTATVARPTAGERRLTNIKELLPTLGDSVISVGWSSDTALIVGTSNSDTPVWKVEIDGASASVLPSGNIVAPVVAVAANTNTLFITDARAALHLSQAGSENYWREIPGLEGGRSITVVPR